MYLAAVRTGRARRQGVGPCQLTYGGYQDQADAIGGCWDLSPNVRIGFRVLAGLIEQNGLRNGFRAYNDSGPTAEAYADDAMGRFSTWQARLGCDSATVSPAMSTVDSLGEGRHRPRRGEAPAVS